MIAIEAIFEGGVFRPMESVSLAEGSRVRLVVADTRGEGGGAPSTPRPDVSRPRRPMVGSAKGVFKMAPDFDAPLEDFKEYM